MPLIAAAAIAGTGGSLYQGYKQGQSQDAALQSQNALTQEQAAQSREMLAYFNQTFKPAEMALISETFGFDPASLPKIEQSPADKARIAELNNLIAARTDNISSTTSRKNQPSRDLWSTEIAKARAEIEQLNQPKYDYSKIGDPGKQKGVNPQLANIQKLAESDPEIKAALESMSGLSTTLNSQTEAGLAKLNALAASNPEIKAGLQSMSGMARGPASAQDFLNESRTPINYYGNNETEAGRAAADVQQSADAERQAAGRRMLSRGVNPNSGEALEFDRLAGLQTSANKVLAANSAREVAREAGYRRALTESERRIRGLGLANDANQGDFNRTGAVVDANRSYDLDQFNKGTTTYNAGQVAGQQDFSRKGAILDSMRGINTDDFNKATSAFNLEQNTNQQDFQKKLSVLGLGRNLQGQGAKGLSNAAQDQGRIASSYGDSARNWGVAAGQFANIGINLADKAGLFSKKP